jgi:hypothetical protein
VGRGDEPSAFNFIFAVFLLAARLAGRSIPERVDARDIALLGMATHKLSLVGSQDAITSPLRAPFTELRERATVKTVKLDGNPVEYTVLDTTRGREVRVATTTDQSHTLEVTTG